MISIRVTSFNGQPLTTPLTGSFGTSGGTIGRGESNQLVLADPDRYVSRLQARVECRNGEWQLTNQGANPINLNGDRLNNGQSKGLKPGDAIRIGPYSLQVEGTAPPAAEAAGGDLLAALKDGPAPQDPFIGAGVVSTGHLNPFARLDVQPASLEPFAPLEPVPAALDPFARLDARVPAPPPGAGGIASSQPHGSGEAAVIPTDFDPFADPLSPPPPPPVSAASIPADLHLLLDPGRAAEGNLDALFGLNDAKKLSGDPLAGTPLSGAPSSDAEGRPLDPLLALSGRQPTPSAPSAAPDRQAEIHGSFQLPRAQPVEMGSSPGAAKELLPQSPPLTLTDSHVFVSWEGDTDSRRINKSTVDVKPLPVQRPAEKPPAAPMQSEVDLARGSAALAQAAVDMPLPPAAPSAGGAAVPPASLYSGAAPSHSSAAMPSHSSASAPGSPANEAELAAALRVGLGLSSVELPLGITPELMGRLGRLLREATQGTLDLLLARAMMKREVRAEVTLIAPSRNNPLKFSPDAAVALAHLMAPQALGFMSPEESLRDAYEDLRSHEIGFMAGMRAALAGVLRRFDPEELEARLKDKSMMDALLPMNRRARLWDLYTELYRVIAAEAADDFNALFGREFVRAYEEQVARLSEERKAS